MAHSYVPLKKKSRVLTGGYYHDLGRYYEEIIHLFLMDSFL